MKKLHLLAIVAIIALMASCGSKETETTAETQTVNPEEKKTTDNKLPAGVETIRVGRQLALYGYQNESPEALIEAANILANVTTTELSAQVTRGGLQCEKQGQREELKREFTPEALLAAARSMANDDPTLLAMADKVEQKLNPQDGERGASCGAQLHEDRVQPGDYDVYKVQFDGNEVAAVVVIGDETTDLDLYIYDENDNLVTSDDEYGDQCACSWVPNATATYTIKIVNRGDVYNDYSIGVN